jgi:hypothetical protein
MFSLKKSWSELVVRGRLGSFRNALFARVSNNTIMMLNVGVGTLLYDVRSTYSMTGRIVQTDVRVCECTNPIPEFSRVYR